MGEIIEKEGPFLTLPLNTDSTRLSSLKQDLRQKNVLGNFPHKLDPSKAISRLTNSPENKKPFPPFFDREGGNFSGTDNSST